MCIHRYLVEQEHEVDGKGNDESNQLQSEKVPGQEANHFVGYLAKIDLGKWRWLNFASFGTAELLSSSHCFKLLLAKVFFNFIPIFSNDVNSILK